LVTPEPNSPTRRVALFVEALIEHFAAPSHIEVALPAIGIHTADVESDVERFGQTYRFILRQGVPMPCLLPLQAGDALLPVDFLPLEDLPRPDAPNWIEQRAAYLYESSLRALMSGLSSHERGVLTDARTALSSFRRRLTAFLCIRIEASEFVEGEPSPIGFPASTEPPGLQVYFYPAHWRQVKGPLAGELLPGRYCFGVARNPHQRPVFDLTETEVRRFSSILLRP